MTLPKLKEIIDAQHPLPIAVCLDRYLKGMNKAVYSDGRLFVCEDVLGLMLDDAELVARHLDVVVVPKMDFSQMFYQIPNAK